MEIAAQEAGIFDLVHAMFYAMTVSYAEELGVLPSMVRGVIEEAWGNFQWFSFEGWLEIHRDEILFANQRAFVAKATATLLWPFCPLVTSR